MLIIPDYEFCNMQSTIPFLQQQQQKAVENAACHWLKQSIILGDEGRTSALESLYGGQFTLSTQLTTPNYLAILPLVKQVPPLSFFKPIINPCEANPKQLLTFYLEPLYNTESNCLIVQTSAICLPQTYIARSSKLSSQVSGSPLRV